jgi:RHS repeat-associated protein
VEYDYDGNGSMTADRNKGIREIIYNHQSLPLFVDMGEDRALRYSYDAAGVKLKKEVADPGAGGAVTDYLAPFVYEDGLLAYVLHPEGRILPEALPPESADTVQINESTNQHINDYQYHLTDHLGNVRMSFSTQRHVDRYLATLEEDRAEPEQRDFHPSWDRATRIASALFNRTAGEDSRYVHRLSGTADERVGLAIVLPVMPGDTVALEVWAKYVQPDAPGSVLPVQLLPAVAMAFGLPATGGGDGAQVYRSLSELIAGGGLAAGRGGDRQSPRAYLNYLLMDSESNIYAMGFRQVSAAAREDGAWRPHERLALQTVAQRPGNIYIYLSNENPEPVDVYFDDLTITHTHHPVFQMDDYYPFGMVLAHLERQPPPNRQPDRNKSNNYLYNGKELQDEHQLDWYDYGARMYDGAVGRFRIGQQIKDRKFFRGIKIYGL